MKKIVLPLLAGVAALGLTSCKGGSDGLDVLVLYKNNSGITYRGADATTGVGGEQLKQGTLLPMWQELEKKFNIKINDVADYSQDSSKKAINKYMQDGYKGTNGSSVEIIQAGAEQINSMYNTKKLTPLSDHLNKMPNFKKYLDENPTIKQQLIKEDGKIYNTPYFDGYNSVEKQTMLNAKLVRLVLDDEKADFDIETTINTAYEAYYEGENYPNGVAGQKVTVVNKEQTGTTDITIGTSKKGYKSAIAAQNAQASGTIGPDGKGGKINGEKAATALQQYIDDAYRYNDELKALYPNRSDIFLSINACYNVDDLVALFRAVKTNPKLCGMQGNNQIFPFVTRSGEAGRQRAVTEIGYWFGVRGLSSEQKALYFGGDNLLYDAKNQERTYESFQRINEIYQENLIVQNFHEGYGGQQKTEFRAELLPKGQVLCTYDDAGTTSPYTVDGASEYTVVLPPVADWKTAYDLNKDPQGKTLNNFFHFTEDTRSLKDGTSAIPIDCDPEYLDEALAILDYMYCDEGADLQDFGPNTEDYRMKVTEYDANGKRIDPNPNDNGEDGVFVLTNGRTSVMKSKKVRDRMTEEESNWQDFSRQFIGSTHQIGHVRNDGLEYQHLSETLKVGVNNVDKAIKLGAMYNANNLVPDDGPLFFSCVPTIFNLTKQEQDDSNTKCKNILSVWLSTDGKHYQPSFMIMNEDEINDVAISKILTKENVENYNKYFIQAYRDAYDRQKGLTSK